MPIPALFLSHGAPTLALEDNAVTRAWGELGRTLAPRAIVAVSAHWDTPDPAVTTASRLATIHDFHGFPRPLYDIRYEPPGDAALAERVTTLLAHGGFATKGDAKRGIDHGGWVPLRFMFPEANVPVIQLSVQPGRDAAHHVALGRALAPLRGEGVLVLGSGGIVHNLRELDWQGEGGKVTTWAKAFNDWIAANVASGDEEALVDWLARAPEPRRAHPTPEHFMPFFVALGAGGFPGRRLDYGFDLGSLGMDGYAFGAR